MAAMWQDAWECRCGSQQTSGHDEQQRPVHVHVHVQDSDCYADCYQPHKACLVETGITGDTEECVTCGNARKNADHNTQDFNDENSCKRFCKSKGSSFAGIKLEGWRCFC